MHIRHGIQLVVGLATLGLGCGGTLKTGTAKKPITAKPADDGSCPTGQSVCGAGSFALCVELQNDSSHCGACDRACSPGIACQAGACQQTVCMGVMAFSDQPAPSVSTGSTAHASVILADVNGDDLLDLVDWQVGQDLSTFRVSLGQPGGGFEAPTPYPSSFEIQSIVATDVDDDGADDLFVISAATPVIPPQRIEQWRGHSSGALTRASASDVSASTLVLGAGDIAIGDVSGDGLPDLVMPADHDSGDLNVFLSDSTGALHSSASYATRDGVGLIFIRDWNGDGSTDLVVAANSLELFYNRGNGTFEPSVDCGVSLPNPGLGNDLVVADFNRDGRMDLALSTDDGSRIAVLLGLGECRFAPISYYAMPGAAFFVLRTADMNGDGQLDLVGIGTGPLPLPQDLPRDHRLAVLLGKPDGTFQPPDTFIPLGGDSLTDVAVGETTGDQRPDVVITGPDGQATTWKNVCQ